MAKQRNVVRVVPSGKNHWNVTQNGQTVSKHRKKETAVDQARGIANKQPPSQLIIHKQNGQFQTEHTYGDDPHPPDG